MIVTTHSMEEAEALGSKMAIMVGGKFKCFGTAQQIKSKYAKGSTLDLKFDLKEIDSKYSDFTQFVYKRIPNIGLTIDSSRKST